MSTEQEIISEFIDEMCSKGCDPAQASDIKPAEPRGGKWPRYTLAGDRPREKNGFYRLKIVTNPRGELMGIGTFGTRRDNKGWPFSSKTTKKWSPEEKAAWKAQREAEDAAAAQLVEQMQQAAKAAALACWKSAGPASPEHPYLVRKKISDVSGIRQLGDELLIPMYADNALWNLQTITAEGDKYFSFRIGDAWSEGGRAAGCYYPIPGAAPGDMSVACLCEGYATGRSIREATGLPVFAAFTSGNLKAVAADVRKRYPQARIIICADNDQWRFNAKKRPRDVKASDVPGDSDSWVIWRAEGRMQNIGVDMAYQAAAASRAWVVFPDIPENDPQKNTDFNDWYLQAGPEPVKSRILRVLETAPAEHAGSGDGVESPQDAPPHPAAGYDDDGLVWCPPEHYEEAFQKSEMQLLYHPSVPVQAKNWNDELSYNDEGVLRGSSKNNVRLFIENHQDYIGMLVYDEFAKEKVIAREPPWELDDNFKPRTLQDYDVTNLAMHLESKGLFPKFSDLAKIVDAVIRRYSRNPAREYFNTIKWDGKPRLDTFLRDVCGCAEDDPEYLAQIFRKWLAGGVRRVRRPGCKMDHMLILEGAQDSGKSTVFRELATIHGREYFDDTIKAKELPDAKTVPKLQGILIIELAEMTGFAKMSDSEAKQIISTQTDRIVQKYHNEATFMPRQFILGASINRVDSGYLTDSSGNRRYWPAKCGDKIDLALLRECKEQLWAEAAHIEAQGEKLYLEEALYAKAQAAQGDRMRVLPWQPDIEELCRDRHHVRVEEIWEKLGFLERGKRTKDAAADIAKIMTGLGYEHTRRRVLPGGAREYAWFKQPRQRSFKIGDEPDEMQPAAEQNNHGQGEEIQF